MFCDRTVAGDRHSRAGWLGPSRRQSYHAAALLAFLLTACLSARTLAARAPGYERYGADEGLASGEVLSIAEDREGYLWVATFASGVHRFDGRSFERFGPQQGLTSQRVKRIHIDRTGRVRVATLAGLFQFDGERFVQDPRLGDAAIYDVLETRDGAFWFATGEGVVRIWHKEILRLGVSEGLPMANATALAEGVQGEVWLGTTRGLARFQAGRMTVWRRHQAGMTNDYITRLLVDKHGRLWVATDWGVASFDGVSFSTLDLGIGERRLYVLDLVVDRKEDLRIATLGAGVLSWDGTRLGQVGLDQGLPSANVWSLAVSQAGGLWIGTEEHGLVLRDDGPFEPVIASERLAGAVPSHLVHTSDGGLWVATVGAGVVRIGNTSTTLLGRPTMMQTLSYKDGLPSDFARRLLPGSAGLWIGTKVGPALWDGHTMTTFDETREPFPVRDMLEDPKGGLWLVNKEQGLVHYSLPAPVPGAPAPAERKWQLERFPLAAEPTPASLWSITGDPRGHLWLGATSALYRFDGHEFQRWTATGLSITDRLVQLLLDAEQRLWFRSDEALGFIVMNGATPTWSILRVPRTAWLILAPSGEVLAGAEEGLYRLRAGNSGGVEVLSVVSSAEGYPPSTADAGGAVWSADGTLLFGTAGEIFRYDPARARGPRPARVHLRRLRLFNQPVPLPDAEHPLLLRYDQNFLSVDFDATAFPAPETLEFRYRLDGLSQSWSPPTVGRVASFPNLPPGSFTVRVQARHGGEWNSEVVSGPILVLPAYWQTWWFGLLISGGGIMLALSLPVLWARTLKRQRDELEQLVAVRTAELARYSGHLEELVVARTSQLDQTYRELLNREAERNQAAEALITANRQASLGRLAGVVAHQVNTPLAAIKVRLALLRDDPHTGKSAESSLGVIERQVDRIARIVRVLLGFVRQREMGGDNTQVATIVQAVVELYAEALRTKGAVLTVVLPSEPLAVHGRTDDLQELLLNLVENAREAVTEKGEIRILVERQKDTLRLLVEDDGCGLGKDPEQCFQPFFTTKITGTGLGLAISRRIAETLGGTLIAENRFSDGRGARFVLTLPLA